MTHDVPPTVARESSPRAAFQRHRWLLLAVGVALWPVAGLFTVSRVFVQRDLTIAFWPRYQWLRDAVYAGAWPWWDPYMGGGQSAVSDALNQFFLLPTVALRLLLPDPVGFNLWVALPFPLAAWGAYKWFRGHESSSPAGAALGAITFAVAGPIVSTGNVPNLSWSVLAMPWLLWAVDRCARHLTLRGLALIAALFGAQACAGEPVTFAVTGVLVVVYTAWAAPWSADSSQAGDSAAADTASASKPGWLAPAPRLKLTAGVAAALALGGALAAVQLVPLYDVVSRSARAGTFGDSTFWSLHPLAMLESIAPTLFGNFFVAFPANQPWMTALNSGREPFFYSLYMGIGVWLLALVGLLGGGQRRVASFWITVAIVALVCAFGDHTPLYPMLQAWIPPLRSFRYPAKYLVVLSLALSALAVIGWGAIERVFAAPVSAPAPRSRGRWAIATVGVTLALVSYGAALMIFVWPDTAAHLLFDAARLARLMQPVEGAAFLMAELPSHATRVLLLSLAAAGLLWVALSGRAEARTAAWTCYAMIVVDLAVTNGVVNPTAERALLTPPSWIEVLREHPHDRFYFGGRRDSGMVMSDIDAGSHMSLPPVDDLLQMRVMMTTRLALTPSPFGVREIMSLDLSTIWPREFTRMQALFAAADRESRQRFLRRAGVRYCFIREPFAPLPNGGGPPPALARIPNYEGAALFECDPQAARAVVLTNPRIVPSLEAQAHKLLEQDEAGDALLMLKAEPPAPAGTPGAAASEGGAPAVVAFVRDDPTVVELSAGVGADGGYLVLRDTFDPFWRAEVDGQPAEILRANLMFRAVRLAPGTHQVRFTYAPVPLYYGAGVSAAALLVVGIMACWRPRPRPIPVQEGTFVAHACGEAGRV